ncbi:speriolin-like protein [Acanthochromis polyacanthus]|uniref:Speriolin-like protein n=1 Tax=Acanthochromis polyacanthus TaxID=80966 RepID=A0A3Q1EKD0_9TELE|nr:speriolin-like protein [Acanthochromis polyacanthus]
MDLEQARVTLQSQNERLKQENDQLKSFLSVMKENIDLRARMQSFNNDTMEDIAASQLKTTTEWQNTLTERQFRNEMQQTKVKQEQRTSSPVDFKTLIQSSMNTDTDVKGAPQSSQDESPPDAEGPDRLFGEISFQLDRRILSFVFQGQKRLYGFTVLNIADKVTEVCTHPLTGKVDEGYRLYLTQRFAGLMDRLTQLGYKMTLHPIFTEFIVNSYGILKERPEKNSAQEQDYNNPDFLKKQILTSAPRQLQKDLLLVLNCLCSMAEMDGKPLFLW